VLTCDICGKQYKNYIALSKHITMKHKVVIKDYYDKFLKKTGEGTCPNCGNPSSFISLSLGYNNFCSHKCVDLYYWNNEERRAKQSKLLSSIVTELWTIPEYKKKKVSQAHNQVMDSKSKFGNYYGMSYNLWYGKELMRSGWEIDFAKLLDQNNIKWEYEKHTFAYGEFNKYTPDFYLPEHDIFIEVKPLSMKNEIVLDKVYCVKSMYHKNIEVLDKSEFDDFIRRLIA